MSAPTALFEPPRTAAWLKPYWDGVARGELRLPRCSKCGTWDWHPLESGPPCADAHYEWTSVGPDFTLFSFTRVEKPLIPGVSEPYFTGLVVADIAPACRIAARLVANGEIKIGARVRLAFSSIGRSSFPYFVVEQAS